MAVRFPTTTDDTASTTDPTSPEQGASFENASEPPSIGRHPFLFDGNDWETVRDAGLMPRNVSRIAGSAESRARFSSGALLLGIDGKRKKLAPQQLLMSDVLDAGHKLNGFLLPRRSSKSTSISAESLGRAEAQEDYRVGILTMTTGKAGRSRFTKDVVPVLERKHPDKESRPFKIVKSAGQERVEFLSSGGSVGWLSSLEDLRGEAFDLVVLDEGGEPEPEKVEAALAAALPTLDTRPGAQLITAGTAGRYRKGNLLWDFLEQGRNGEGGIIEFATSESVTVEDLEHWENVAQLVLDCHPGVNTLTTLDSIKGNWAAMKPETFLMEYLGIFGMDGASKGLIKPRVWERLARRGELPQPPERFALAIAAHRDQRSAAIVAAWREADGKAVGLVLAAERGITWLAPKALELSRKYQVPIVHDSQGVVLAETEALARKRPKPRMLSQTTKQITTAAALLVKEIETGNFVHFDQPALNAAASAVTKRRILSSWGLGSESLDDDITPIEAVAMALRVYDDSEPKKRLKPNF